MGRSITVAAGGEEITLNGKDGVQAKLAVRGTGMAPVAIQWFEGAGEGASFRGGRVLPRQFDLPVKIYADRVNPYDRELVRTRMAKLARIMALANAPVRLTLDLNTGAEGGDKWWSDMVRIGGGEWNWDRDTDGRSYIKTTFTLQAGDPYWTSLDEDSKVISPEGVGIGLLGVGISLAQMRVGSTAGFGATTIHNTGDVLAYPVWTFDAPFSGFTLTSQYGESLSWVGTTPKATGKIIVNTKDATVVDETGANRYTELGTAPQFWPVRRGETAANVVLADASAASRASARWNIRREVLF